MQTQEIIDLAGSDAEIEAGKERYNELLVRSATDLDFRQKLLADPIGAIAEFNGVERPETTLNIRFVENEADVTIVLPDPIRFDAELSDDELEAVAGGGTVTTFVTLSTAACASAVISAAAVYGVYKLAKE